MTLNLRDIKAEREQLGLTQADMALVFRVVRITYLKWESEPRNMKIWQYEAVCDFLDNYAARDRELRGVHDE